MIISYPNRTVYVAKFTAFGSAVNRKIEKDETPEDCLMRELFEELGIGVRISGFCAENTHVYEDLSVHLLAYYCKHIEGKIELRVHDKLKWVSIQDLLDYDLLPADIPIVEQIKEDFNAL